MIAQANRPQIEASDPNSSVWVSASAGSGKTYALTNRVLRLLLDGALPDKILCLTYTRAAAAEMTERVRARLSSWATLPPDDLDAALYQLTANLPSEATRTRARKLYALVLDRDLKIQTLHGFCQSLLKRFPLEAGLSPRFDMLDEREAKELMSRARARTFSKTDDENSPLASALDLVTTHLTHQDIEKILSAMLNERDALERSVLAVPDSKLDITYLKTCLGNDVGSREDELIAFCKGGDLEALQQACHALSGTSSKKNLEMAQALDVWLTHDNRGAKAVSEYKKAWYRADDTLKKEGGLTAPSFAKDHPECFSTLIIEQSRVASFIEQESKRNYAELCAALARLARSVLQDYTHLKNSQSALDFDDLILRTVALLNDQSHSGSAASMAAWVLYKLDGGLDHLLLDEAQDTNPDQWRIISSLLAEFLSGDGHRERTLFVVGDEKQSIYGFQRADAEEFTRMHTELSRKIVEARRDFRDTELTISYRSVAPILTAVDAVFSQELAAQGVVQSGRVLNHIPHRAEQSGRVELWPLAPNDPRDTPAPSYYWRASDEQHNTIAKGSQHISGVNRLAAGLAGQVKTWLEQNEPLEAQGRAMTPGDILILVRKRSNLAREIIKSLEALNVPVGGLDRLTLMDDIAVCDILSLLRFLLLPEDDLALAECLKSPLVGLDENDLFEIAWTRKDRWGTTSLYGALVAAATETKSEFLQKRLQTCANWFDTLLARTDFLTPHDLMTAILHEPCPGNAQSGRRAFASRLGQQCWEPLSELLNLALLWGRGRAATTQGFLSWLESGDMEIKREMEGSQVQHVRLMTVHGSKGLQSPVVILPDTVSENLQPRPVLWTQSLCPNMTGDGTALPWWAGHKPHRTSIPFDLRNRAIRREAEEQHRLLYVAMTRAADRLIVCGHLSKNHSEVSEDKLSDCWYSHVRKGLEAVGAQTCAFDSAQWPVASGYGWQGESLFIQSLQQGQITTPKATPIQTQQKHTQSQNQSQNQSQSEPLDNVLLHIAKADPLPPAPLNPSKLDAELQPEPAGLSPLLAFPATEKTTLAPASRFRRGLMIHRLLQALAGLPPEDWQRAGQATLKMHLQADMDSAEAKDAFESVTAVLSTPGFAPLFGPHSRGEVPIVGQVGKRLVSGRIDRLAILEESILIVDYKSNRPAARTIEEISDSHLMQLAAYRCLLKGLWPNKNIRCALLWTEGPHLMEIPDVSLPLLST